MNTRGRRLVNLVKESDQSSEITSHGKDNNRPESPVPYNDCTEEEWSVLQDIYDNAFPASQAESGDDVILGSEEGTPMPSPSSGQDFYIETHSTENPVNTPNKEDMPTSSPIPNQDVHVDSPQAVNQDPVNIPSVNSLISIPENENPFTPNSSTSRKRKATYKADPGRKRKRHINQWIDTRRKLLTNSGNQYVSKRGKTVPAKTLKQACPATCKLKCSESFTEEIRKNIFDEYWKLSDHSKQWAYINKFTKRYPKRRMTTEGPSRRQFTTKYYLPVPVIDSYEAQQVCLKMFCHTLSVTDQTIRTAHEKLDTCGITGSDNRGKHQNHAKKIDEEMIRSVCNHVKSFQPVESHYTRKNTSKLYLDNSLSFNKMFSMYKDWPDLHLYNNTAETERQYRNIINDHMNIAFFIPKKDMCDKCHAFTNHESPTEEQISAHNKHIANKEIARNYKAKDKEDARNNAPKVVCATYDFQKILHCPSGEVSLFYYKRKLSLMHFTVFDTGIKEASCYLWPENVAKRGANEVGSCLLSFIEKKVSNGAMDIRFWSDNCSGQNRNRVIYSLYMYASNKYNVDITHRFLESGHTQQEADSVHALIERTAKGKIIYTPDQWYALVRWAKTNNEPYNVIEVSQDMLYNLKELLQNRNFKKNTLNQDVKWNNIKEICVKKSEPNVILYKYDLESDYLTLNTLVSTRRNRKTVVANSNSELKVLYSDSLPISDAKYKDLMSLCQAGHIRKQYHGFFKNLKTSQNENINVSGSDEDD
ncbi:uncharacterized protein [Choristoneura fumiferana]|uniref:uncharacterized protein n=1 Tax=Choristoneura fumiferana TaxID=7141 RepID=UPI003D15ADD1